MSTRVGAPVILNVDDSDGARYAKSRVLRLAGFDVIEAARGEQALLQAREAMPDLVLLDTRLPDLNGFEVCRRLKSDPVTSKVLVLQTSASFLNSADKIRALDGGADSYLIEPIESEELIANVKALLRLRQAERQLLDSETRFRELAENITDIFWMCAPPDGEVLYVSPAYETVWQRAADTLHSDPLDWLNAIHADDRERVALAFRNLLAYQPYEEEYRLLLANGNARWVRDRGYPVRNDIGETYRVARITQDISERKFAEEQLHLADRRKDEFLATLAHELRNPLGPILHSVQLLKLDPTPQRVEKNAAMIERQTRHLIDLVDDLLDIARITQGKITIRQEYVELKTFVRSAIEAVQPFLDSRKHALTVTLPDERAWVFGDATRLSQVVANLLNNAGKYTMSGGKISLHATIQRDSVAIEIADNGIGIPPEKVASLFELFVQADHAPDRAQDGLGIGLSLVRNLVELHGGCISVASEGEGRGSRFSVALPLADRAVAEAGNAASQKPSSPASHARRILVVDDNADAAETLAMTLRADGHQVEIANDGASAMGAAKRFLPEVVFLDIGLPGMSGYEIAQQMRALPATRAAQLIALTGYGQEKDKRAAVSAGFDNYLVKPADSDLIRRVLIGKV